MAIYELCMPGKLTDRQINRIKGVIIRDGINERRQDENGKWYTVPNANQTNVKKSIKNLHSEVYGDFSGIKGDVLILKGDVTGLKGDVSKLKGDVTNIHGTIHESLEGRVTNIKGDISGLEGFIENLKGDVSNIKGSGNSKSGDVTNIRGRLGKLEGNLSGLKGDVSGIWGIATGIIANLDNHDVPAGEGLQGFRDIRQLVGEKTDFNPYMRNERQNNNYEPREAHLHFKAK